MKETRISIPTIKPLNPTSLEPKLFFLLVQTSQIGCDILDDDRLRYIRRTSNFEGILSFLEPARVGSILVLYPLYDPSPA